MNQGPPPIILEIDRAMRANDTPRAALLAERALAGGLSHPILFTLRAWARRRDGQLEGALEDLRAAHKLNPKSTNVLVSTAEVLNALGRFSPALKAAAEALALDRNLAPAWFQRAHAQQMTNLLDAAAESYNEALKRDPRLAEALSRLAELAVLQGKDDAARDYAQRALALRPGDVTATMALARADIAAGRFDAAEPRLTALLANKATPPAARAVALGHVGDARDAQDRVQEAFDAYAASAAAWHAAHAQRLAGHESALVQVERVTRTLEPWQPSGPPPRAAGDDSRDLVFILGFPRSGTTLLAQILAAAPDVAVLEEKPVFAKAAEDFFAAPDGMARLAALSDAQVAHYRDDVWRRIRDTGVATTDRVVLDQNALNTAYLPLIARLFPAAKIVFALRDPRDVVFSCLRRQFGANLFTLEFHSLASTAAFYAAMMELAQACRARLGLDVLDIRNEDLIADFDGCTQRLCAFTGVPWSESLRDFQNQERTVATISAQQVRRGISARGVGQWRRYEAQLAPVLPALAPFAARFGYTV